MATSHMNGSRLLRATYAGIATACRSFLRVAHMLWLEVTGVFFCAFAVMFAARVPRAYADHSSGRSPKFHLVLLVCLTIMFAWFGVSSFWRARKK
jgi:hypothetical protein